MGTFKENANAFFSSSCMHKYTDFGKQLMGTFMHFAYKSYILQ